MFAYVSQRRRGSPSKFGSRLGLNLPSDPMAPVDGQCWWMREGTVFALSRVVCLSPGCAGRFHVGRLACVCQPVCWVHVSFVLGSTLGLLGRPCGAGGPKRIARIPSWIARRIRIQASATSWWLRMQERRSVEPGMFELDPLLFCSGSM